MSLPAIHIWKKIIQAQHAVSARRRRRSLLCSLSHTHTFSSSLSPSLTRGLLMCFAIGTVAYMCARIHVLEKRKECVWYKNDSVSILNNCATITESNRTKHISSPVKSPCSDSITFVNVTFLRTIAICYIASSLSPICLYFSLSLLYFLQPRN